MTTVAVILAIALALTLAALYVVLIGTSHMLDTERHRTDTAERRVRELEAERIQTTRDPIVRPLRQSPSFAPVADILARNEAARFDPDTHDWGDAS